MSDYKAGGREVTPTSLLLLISTLEGSYKNLKYMGFYDDMDIIDSMKKVYYKMYFKLKKEQKNNASSNLL